MNIEREKRVENAVANVGPLVYKSFKGIDIVNLPSKEFLEKGHTMIVCTHRSHLDYVLLGVILHRAGIKKMRFAAGDNLTTLPVLGKMFLSYGAFSVSRGRATNRSYIFKLAKKVKNMLINGDSIMVFPEGGRSYSGKMEEMKSGVMGSIVHASFERKDIDFYILPVSISYEMIPDLSFFEILLKGKEMLKSKRGFLKKILGSILYFGPDILAFSWFFIAHKFGKKFGRVYVDFADPINVRDIVDIDKNYRSNASNEFFAHKDSVRIIESDMHEILKKLYRILPVHIVCAAIKDKKKIKVDKLKKNCESILNKLENKDLNLKTVLNKKDIFDAGIEILKKYKAIKMSPFGKKVVIRKKYIIQYYANTLIGVI